MASNIHVSHANAARENKSNAKSDDAKLCFSNAAMCHDTAARLVARVEMLSKDAVAYRQASAAAAARRRHDVAEQLGKRADEVDVAIAATPGHADKWHLRGLEHSARGHEHDKSHPDVSDDKQHENWLKHLGLGDAPKAEAPKAEVAAVEETKDESAPKPRASR